jgi:hypothetical protein
MQCAGQAYYDRWQDKIAVKLNADGRGYTSMETQIDDTLEGHFECTFKTVAVPYGTTPSSDASDMSTDASDDAADVSTDASAE